MLWATAHNTNEPISEVTSALLRKIDGLSEDEILGLLSPTSPSASGAAREPSVSLTSLLRLSLLRRRWHRRRWSAEESLQLAALGEAQGRLNPLISSLLMPLQSTVMQSLGMGEDSALGDSRSAPKRPTLGVLLPLSGPYRSLGRRARAAIRLAARGARIRLHFEDTKGDEDEATLAVERLAQRSEVLAALGPIGIREGAAATRRAVMRDLPILSLSRAATLPAGVGVALRRRRLATRQARSLLRFACHQRGLRRIAVIGPERPFSPPWERILRSALRRCRGQVVAFETYPSGEDPSEAIQRLIGRHRTQGGRVSSYWRRLNRKSRDRAHLIPPQINFDGLLILEEGENLRRLLTLLPYWDLPIRTLRGARPSLRDEAGDPLPAVQLLLLEGARSLAENATLGRGDGGSSPPQEQERSFSGEAERLIDGALLVASPENEARIRFAEELGLEGARAGELLESSYEGAHYLITLADALRRPSRGALRRRLSAADPGQGLAGPLYRDGSGELYGLYRLYQVDRQAGRLTALAEESR